jgi:hypothetical protein
MEKPLPSDPAGQSARGIGMDPLEVGRRAVAGIEHDELFIITHSDLRHSIQARHEAVIAGFDAADQFDRALS